MKVLGGFGRLRRRAPDDFDEGMYESMLRGMQLLIDKGMPADEAAGAAASALMDTFDSHTPGIVASLARAAPRALRRNRRADRRFTRQLRAHWGLSTAGEI